MVGRPSAPPQAAPAPAPAPAPDPLPPPPSRSSAETASLAERARERYSNRQRGRAATMLTGGEGAESGSRAVRFLGGAGV